MWEDLPQYLRRDLRRLHGDLWSVVIWPLTVEGLLAAVDDVVIRRGKPLRLDHWQWHSCSQFGARQTIAIVEGRLLVDGFYQRRGEMLIFRPRAC